jgi:hypothetical protein
MATPERAGREPHPEIYLPIFESVAGIRQAGQERQSSIATPSPAAGQFRAIESTTAESGHALNRSRRLLQR